MSIRTEPLEARRLLAASLETYITIDPVTGVFTRVEQPDPVLLGIITLDAPALAASPTAFNEGGLVSRDRDSILDEAAAPVL